MRGDNPWHKHRAGEWLDQMKGHISPTAAKILADPIASKKFDRIVNSHAPGVVTTADGTRYRIMSTEDAYLESNGWTITTDEYGCVIYAKAAGYMGMERATKVRFMPKCGMRERLIKDITDAVAQALRTDMTALNAQNASIVSRLTNIEGDLKNIMATQADLDTAIAGVTTAVNTLGTDLTKAIADLQAKITASGTPIDLSSEMASLTAIATTAQGFDASTVAADPGAAPAPPATP